MVSTFSLFVNNAAMNTGAQITAQEVLEEQRMQDRGESIQEVKMSWQFRECCGVRVSCGEWFS